MYMLACMLDTRRVVVPWYMNDHYILYSYTYRRVVSTEKKVVSICAAKQINSIPPVAS